MPCITGHPVVIQQGDYNSNPIILTFKIETKHIMLFIVTHAEPWEDGSAFKKT